MKLSEICDINRSNVIFTKDQMVDYLDTGNLTEGVIDSLTKVRYDEAPSRAQRAVQKNTILYSTVRPNLKHYGILEERNPNMVVSTGFATIDIKENKKEEIDAHFLYYLITQPWVTEHLHTIAQSSVSSYPSISPNDIGNLEFRFPRIDDQRRIASVLSNLDRKIALNRQINTNLEALARQLYDYWFVQFDFPDANGKPYKSSGGKMTYNEKLKRNIPDGWEVKNIFDAVDVLYGFPFNADLFTTETTTIPVIRIRDILEGNISTYTTECVNEKYRLHEKDVVIGMDGNFHMGIWHNNDAYLNQRCVRLRANEKTEISAIQILYTTQPYIKYREKTIIGSTVGHLSDKDMKALYILVPVGNKYFAPRKTMDSITQQIIENKKQITSLTKQRDELLPLLMNGQVII